MTRPEAAASLPTNQVALREAMLHSLNWRQRDGNPEPKWRPAWRQVADWLRLLRTRLP